MKNGTSMKLTDYLDKKCVIPDLQSATKPEVLQELAGQVTNVYTNLNTEKVSEILIEREELCSTAVDKGVAIPHGKIGGISGIITAFGRSLKGIDFDSLDEKTTHLFMLILAPENSSGLHIKLLARTSLILKKSDTRSNLLKAESREELYNLLVEEDEKLQ